VNDTRSVLVASVIVLAFMTGSFIGIPWLFEGPYDGSERHAIAHESTEAFNETVEEYAIQTDNPTSVDDLSPTARTLVENAIDGETQSSGADGWTSYSATFCQERMPLCDEYEERPRDFTYGERLSAQEQYDVIETDDGLSLLKTGSESIGTPGPFGGDTKIVFGFLAFLPAAGALFFATVGCRESNPKSVVVLAAYGFSLTTIGIAEPFLQLYYDFSFTDVELLSVALPLLSWASLVTSVVYSFYLFLISEFSR